MDRRRPALVLLLLFALCTGISVVVSGSRPHLEQGIAPAVAQFVGYALALLAAVLLIASADDGPAGGSRRTGWVVLAALVVLVPLEFLAADGPDIGAGFVRLLALVAVMVATIRLAQGMAGGRRAGVAG